MGSEDHEDGPALPGAGMAADDGAAGGVVTEAMPQGCDFDRSVEKKERCRRRPLSVSEARSYPVMRSFLKNAEEIPHGIRPQTGARTPLEAEPATRKPEGGLPMPHRVVRRPPKTRQNSVSRLDDMLRATAEGLLVGEGSHGQPEIRVSLRDEFFGGAELRVSQESRGILAVLVPPDWKTYHELRAHEPELQERLAERGLPGAIIRVDKP